MATICLSLESASALIYPKGYLGTDFDTFRRACEGAKYDKPRNLSVAPLSVVPTILQRLREAGLSVEVEPELVKALQDVTAQQWLDLQGAKERAAVVDEQIQKLRPGKRLRPYQHIGVQWLAIRNAAVLADEMGLGKTLETLAAIPPKSPILVVCPALAKGVWRREIAFWRPHLSVTTLEGRGSFRWPEPGEVIIINYDILSDGHKKECDDRFCLGCHPYLEKAPKGLVVIADEGHMLKSAKAKRTRNFRAIAERARKIGGRSWLLTGTPLLNRPPELWNVFQCAGVAQEAFGTSQKFKDLFSASVDRFGATHWGTPSEEIVERIQRVMLRRTIDDVASDIPKKSYRIIDVDIDKKTLAMLDEVLKELDTTPEQIEALLEEGKAIKFEQISAVRAALATAKIPSMLDRVADYEEAEEPLVVFSAHRAPIDTLRKRDGWRVITGDTPSRERTEIEEGFQRGEYKGVGCTIDAGGAAITLTYACKGIFVDRKWTPGLNDQGEGRLRRLNQEKPMLFEFLVANHPLDERVAGLLIRKQNLIDATVEAARRREDGGEGGSDEGEGDRVDLSEANLASSLQAQTEAVAKTQEETERREREPEAVKPNKFRPPRDEMEKWAAQGLRRLDDLDPDRAQEVNGAGFNKIDGPLGSSLRAALDDRGGLSDAQWKVAIHLCRKYHRQVGKPPGAEE